MKFEKDFIDILFNFDAKDQLFSLVDRKDPNGMASGMDDTFENTVSSIFSIYSELMEMYTPDLYPDEWNLILRAIIKTGNRPYKLPLNLEQLKAKLVLSLEDLDDVKDEHSINSFELSKKLAGFDMMHLCAIYFHIQKALVSTARGKAYKFPVIEFKG